MKNSTSYLIKNECIFANVYEYYKSAATQMAVLVTEAHLTDLMLENLTMEDRYLVLEKAQRNLINMVPHNREREYKDLSGDFFGSSNYFMP